MVAKTIRGKLLVGYAAVLLLTVCVILSSMYFQINNFFIETSKEYLRQELQVVIERLQKEEYNPETFPLFLSRETMGKQGPHQIKYALFDKEGLLIARSENFSEDQNSVDILSSSQKSPEGNFYEHAGENQQGDKIFFITRRLEDSSGGKFFLQFGLEAVGDPRAFSIMLKTLFWAFPLIMVLAICGGVFLTGKVLTPILKVTQAARELPIVDGDELLPLSGTDDEIDQLTKAFNHIVKQLRQAYQRIVAFTADASHELRLPITAMKGEAEVVLDRERNIGEYQKVLSGMIEDMDRVMQMINRWLSLTRADSGQDQLEKESLDLVLLVSELCDFYNALAENKKLKLSFVAEQENMHILADRMKMQELISNVIENAVKYTPEGGKIEVSLKKSVDKYSIEIEDTGIGIAPEHANKIFDRFYRIDKSRSRLEGGAGLGLSIARMIAEAHKGKISIISAPTQGSTFTITLPQKNKTSQT